MQDHSLQQHKHDWVYRSLELPRNVPKSRLKASSLRAGVCCLISSTDQRSAYVLATTLFITGQQLRGKLRI